MGALCARDFARAHQRLARGRARQEREGRRRLSWWGYQRERFPLLAHGALILAFSSSRQLLRPAAGGRARPASARPSPPPSSPRSSPSSSCASPTSSRISRKGCALGPYRAVPGGLVTPAELGWWRLGRHPEPCWRCGPATGPGAAPRWSTGFYLAPDEPRSSSRGSGWQARPVVYLLLPHGDPAPDRPSTPRPATGGGRPARPAAPSSWSWSASGTALVIELGRKIRAPEEEEPGVETYTRPSGGAGRRRWRGGALCAWPRSVPCWSPDGSAWRPP